jgi:FtsP/CotA-like multicopper oxidase with cupredoxin domain
VLNSVHPATGAQYRWDIDEDGEHHVGMQWYHPHIHGTTSIQVASGAAGAWIVRGELDSLDGIADATERVMLFSTPPVGTNGFEPLADGEACTDETITFDDFSTLGDFTASQVNLINGERRPRLVTAPGQVERWRLLHAGFLDEVFLGLFRATDVDCRSFSTAEEDTLELTQIGRDGLILPQTFSDSYLFLSPGYRIEAMLGGEGVFEHGDTWCLVAARFLQESDRGLGEFGDQPMAPAEPPTVAGILQRFDTDGDVIAIVEVTEDAGPATETELPSEAAIAALAPSTTIDGVDIETRCAEAAAVTSAADVDQVAMLQVGFWTVDEPDPCDCEPYNVNCNNFELTDRTTYPYDRDMPLGAVEHWRIAASVDGHPFHIHINPYVVCPEPNVFDPLPFPHWRDTFLVNGMRKVDVITQNRGFTGPFVFHCHKLTHEDHGMMEIVRICDPATDATCGDYGWRECAEGDLSCIQALAATDCALGARGPVDAAACVAALGSPLGVCGPNACGSDADCDGGLCVGNVCEPTCDSDDDCPLTDRCDDLLDLCVPAPCPLPCAPETACEHGVCR